MPFCRFGADLERESARVVHDHAHREDVLRLRQRAHAVRLGRLDPEIRELGQVLGDGVVQFKLALLDEDGDRHAAEALRLRALHVGIVRRDRALGRDVRVADARDLLGARLAEDADRARQLAVVDERLQRVAREGRGGREDGTDEHEARPAFRGRGAVGTALRAVRGPAGEIRSS